MSTSDPLAYYDANVVETLWLVQAMERAGGWRMAILRYFGESSNGRPNNLMPFVCQVTTSRHECFKVFGDDYPSPDGTGVRNYIHVVDLARGHMAVPAALDGGPRGRRADSVLTVNLGTGRGHSVFEVVRAFKAASGCPVPFVIRPRRPGDVATCFADPSLAHRMLYWKAGFDHPRMYVDAWRWQHRTPQG